MAASYIFLQVNRIEIIGSNEKKTSTTSRTKNVRIFTKNTEEVFRCKWVVITFSIGALQNEMVRFYPRLPAMKRESIDSIDMIDYTVVYIKWPYRFWTALGGDTKFIALTGDRIGYWQYIINLDHPDLHNGSLLWRVDLSADEEALRAQFVDENETKQHIMERLKGRFQNVPEPEKLYITRWSRNRFVRGSYTSYPVGFEPGIMERIRTPYAENVLFCGTYLSKRYDGYVHGAYLEGQNVAKYLLEKWSESESE